MKSIFKPKALLTGVVMGTIALSRAGHAEYKNIDECMADSRSEREKSICKKIYKEGAFGLQPSNERRKSISDALNLSSLPNAEAAARLRALDVKYLFMADRRSLEKDTSNRERIQWNDKLGGGRAISKNGVVGVSSCTDDSKEDLEVSLNRASPLRELGSYFVVKDSEQGPASLTNQDAFTVGAWVKVNMTDVTRRQISPGYHQILAKGGDPAANASAGADLSSQWVFKVTGDTAYLIVNRGDSSQNINFDLKTAWWGDTWGSCYGNDLHRECWHFVAIAVDPAKQDVRMVFLRGTYDVARTSMSFEDYTSVEKADSRTLAKPIPQNAGPLLLGAGGLSSYDGSMTGAFLARRALSAEEIKGIAVYTAPQISIRMCESQPARK